MNGRTAKLVRRHFAPTPRTEKMAAQVFGASLHALMRQFKRDYARLSHREKRADRAHMQYIQRAERERPGSTL